MLWDITLLAMLEYIVNLTLENKRQWNFNRNWSIFIQENAFENIVCEMASNLSWPQCVKDPAFYDIVSTLCDLILLECQNIVILGDYNCDFIVDPPERYMWNFWFTKSDIWSDLSQKNKVWLTSVWYQIHCGLKKALNLDCWLSDLHSFISITTSVDFYHFGRISA